MRLSKILLTSFLMMLFVAAKQIPKEDTFSDCSVKVESELVTLPGTGKPKLVIKASGGKTPYIFLLLNKKGTPMSFDFTKNEFEGLETGNYRCIVLDKNECRTEISIAIK